MIEKRPVKPRKLDVSLRELPSSFLRPNIKSQRLSWNCYQYHAAKYFVYVRMTSTLDSFDCVGRESGDALHRN